MIGETNNGFIPDLKIIEECSHENSSSDKAVPERQQWNNKIEFLLSCISLSVGLGNVWRFPFTAYKNGGGAFLIPYACVLIFIGRPLYFLELVMGQFSSQSAINVWESVPALKGIGYAQCIASCSVVSYYTSLIALSIYYLVASCQSVLPWTVCTETVYHNIDKGYNDTVCISSGHNATEVVQNVTENGLLINESSIYIVSSAEYYFTKEVLKLKDNIDDGIGNPDGYLTGCMAAVYIILFFVMFRGTSSSGKFSYVMAIFPYIVLFALLGRGLTLPGAMDGIMFYITPNWSSLLDLRVWYEAVVQSFFSLSVGYGSIISFSSFNDFRHNTYKDAIIISFVDTFTSFIAGFAIFSILGNLSYELNEPINKIIRDGAGLAFISYPMAIGKFSVLPQLFSVLFFLMLITLGLGSAAGLLGGAIYMTQDNYPQVAKYKVTLLFCVAGFLIGLVYITPGGQFILVLVDYYGGGFLTFIFALAELIGMSYLYGLRRLILDIKFMLNMTMGIYWKITWGLLTPLALFGIFIYFFVTFKEVEYGGKPFPSSAIYAGWSLALLGVIQLPLWFFYSLYQSKDCCIAIKPSDKWGPLNPETKMEYIMFMKEKGYSI